MSTPCPQNVHFCDKEPKYVDMAKRSPLSNAGMMFRIVEFHEHGIGIAVRIPEKFRTRMAMVASVQALEEFDEQPHRAQAAQHPDGHPAAPLHAVR
ncbi:hypothetical protein D3C87_1741590 [compost metagenome]